MKPSRGKRRGPQSPRVGFNSQAACRPCRGMSNGSLCAVGRVAAGALSARGAPRPVCWRSEASGQGDLGFGLGVIGPVGVGPPADRGRPSRSASCLVSGRSFKLGGLSPVPSNRGRSSGGCLGVDLASVANRSVPCPTRLETRTKESNMCASRWASTKPGGAVKAKASFRWPR